MGQTYINTPTLLHTIVNIMQVDVFGANQELIASTTNAIIIKENVDDDNEVPSMLALLLSC